MQISWFMWFLYVWLLHMSYVLDWPHHIFFIHWLEVYPSSANISFSFGTYRFSFITGYEHPTIHSSKKVEFSEIDQEWPYNLLCFPFQLSDLELSCMDKQEICHAVESLRSESISFLLWLVVLISVF
jgi:hypothetical protein